MLAIIKGFAIGFGAILPGVSGGVLSVIFKIYEPYMEILSNPKEGLVKYKKKIPPILIGWILGFVFGAKLIIFLFNSSETIATCLFIGLILGSVPSLFKESKYTKNNKQALLSLVLGFLVLFAILLYSKYWISFTLKESFFSYIICGVLWGLSLVIPGMTSSPFLIAFEIFNPFMEGLVAFDMGVIIPWIIGLVATTIALAKVIKKIFNKNYTVSYCIIIGLVLASTFSIIPINYIDQKEFIISMIALIVGIVLGYFGTKENSIKD